MSYEPTNWKKGDKVTSTRLNKIENGIQGNDTEISDLKSGLREISEIYHSEEETVEVNVPLDLSNIKVSRLTTDQVGQSMNLNTSSVTTALIRVFTCEAGKTYTLTITNGTTPALIANRATVVISTLETSGATILEVFRSTNTENAQDVFEFTPTVSGFVYFNLDKNYQSVSVTTTETQVITEKTAVDKKARNDIANAQSTITELSNEVEQLSADVESFGETVDGIKEDVKNVVETYQDGTKETDVPLDLTDIHVGYFSSDKIGQTIAYTSSSVTSSYANVFDCEADKTYVLITYNGDAPAKIAERGTVVITADDGTAYPKIAWTMRTKNTANVKDVVEFTPTVSGHVHFNLDKNVQSFSVSVREANIVASAIDRKARGNIGSVSKYILNGTVEKTITWESGTFDANLTDANGSGYRSNVIDGVNGCVVCVKVDPSYAFVYGDGINPLATIYGIYVIHCKTDSFRIGLSDTPETVGFEMRIYKERGHKGRYDIIVAANDSSDEDKAQADIVCDGVNDELDLQFAVNWNFGREARVRYNDKCNVLLLTGTYNIDSFTQQYTADGQLTRERYAVMFGNNTPDNYRYYTYRVSIEGCYETEHGKSNCATLINVTSAGVETLSSEVLNAVFGIVLFATGNTGATYSNCISMIVRNLGMYTNGIPNKIIAIDAYQAGNTVIENCDLWAGINAYQAPDTVAAAPEGSIGIRAGRGSCLGVRQSIKGNRIQGFHDGISLCGEHFIVQDNLEMACVYGFSTNQYPVGGAVQHPNIFIGNSVEQCLHMGRLGESGMRDTLVYIGGSVENTLTAGETRVAMLPIEISATTNNRGRIESDSLASPYMESMFYEGYGQTFEQTIYPYYQA